VENTSKTGTPGRDHSVPVGGIISLWWAASFRYGGRHHPVIVGDIDRNQHAMTYQILLPPYL